jgi:tetratricopeptide (TPR) repeat protein
MKIAISYELLSDETSLQFHGNNFGTPGERAHAHSELAKKRALRDLEHQRKACGLFEVVSETGWSRRRAKLGSAFEYAGNLECALLHFRADLDEYTNVVTLYNYGSILQKLGRYQESVTYLEQALQKDPTQTRISDQLTQAKAKRYDLFNRYRSKE